MVLHQMWCVANLRIRSVKCRETARQYVFMNRKAGFSLSILAAPMVTTDGHNSAFYLTNARELQDVPGEWYHDIDARKVYYYPREGGRCRGGRIVPAVETLVGWKELWIVLCAISF
jgi:hypothetical protein